MKRRKGFTLIEMIAATVLLALIVIACAALTTHLAGQKVVTEATVYLSTHNLNCMERLRQKAATIGDISSETLTDYYGDEEFGNLDIETHVYIERASIEQFTVYRVTIKSKMREIPQTLTSRYILTSIGVQNYDTVINAE